MNKVLITGGTGFVGCEVTRQMMELDKEVTVLGRTTPIEKISFIQADLTDGEKMEKALEGKSYDYIIHLASLPGDTGDPLQMIKVNVNGCHNILEYARKVKVKRFVLASSISAYEWFPTTKFNKPDYMPVDEDHPCRPRDMYSTSKLMQELLVMTYWKQYNVPATVLRLTAVIGPRGKGGARGWREFAEQLSEGKKIQIPHFSAEELCHYIDIRDVGRMFIAAAEHPGAVGEIFNCCGPTPTRGTELASIIKDIKPGIKIEYGFPWSMAQGEEISFDMSKAEKIINFRPKYSVTDSIASIKEWIDEGGLKKNQNKKKEDFVSGVVIDGEN